MDDEIERRVLDYSCFYRAIFELIPVDDDLALRSVIKTGSVFGSSGIKIGFFVGCEEQSALLLCRGSIEWNWNALQDQRDRFETLRKVCHQSMVVSLECLNLEAFCLINKSLGSGSYRIFSGAGRWGYFFRPRLA